MSSNLEIKIDNSTEMTICYFSGQIDEDADFSAIKSLSETKFVFDLEKITMINSCGIRDWIAFQTELPENCDITYRKCPQVIIEQLNIVKGFIKEGGVIESFFAPYFNEAKDEEVKVLLKPLDVVDSKAPVRKDDDGNELEFDEIELQYFHFLKSRK